MSHQPLPVAWVDRIFAKLTLTYGRAFLSQYEGIDMHMVKVDWATELAGFQNNPSAIKHGLENLPKDRPPNVLQFRAICRTTPPPIFKSLPSPTADPEKVRALIAELKSKFTATTTRSNHGTR